MHFVFRGLTSYCMNMFIRQNSREDRQKNRHTHIIIQAYTLQACIRYVRHKTKVLVYIYLLERHSFIEAANLTYQHHIFGTCGLSQSPAGQFGTHCQIRYAIQTSSLNVMGGTSKRISLPSDIRDISASEVSSFYVIALYTNRHLLLIYLLTYKMQ